MLTSNRHKLSKNDNNDNNIGLTNNNDTNESYSDLNIILLLNNNRSQGR